MDYSKDLIKKALEIKAIKINPDNPFTWASGYRMPIYNDNRMFLGDYHTRKMISKAFMWILEEEGIEWEIIAGTSTAGISPATTLADSTGSALIYVRPEPKKHGLRNQIESIDDASDLGGKEVVLIEDLIATGGSSAGAVQAIRDANGVCNHCLSIFDYGLDKATKRFRSLDPVCHVKSIATYSELLEIAKTTGYIDSDQANILEEWREDPFNWGEKRGFPRVEK